MCGNSQYNNIRSIERRGTFRVTEGSVQLYKINERRDVGGIQWSWMPVRGMKFVGSQVVRLKRRRWWEEQLKCLHRRAMAELVRKGGGRYAEKQGNGGAA